MKWSVVLIFILLTISRAARADDFEEIRALTEEGRFGEAFHRITPLVREHPEDSDLQYMAAWICIQLVRYDEARLHIAQGLTRAPGDARILAISAALHLAEDNLGRARQDAQRALAAQPQHVLASRVLHELDLIEQARTRRAGQRPDFEPGSAPWLVDRMFERGFAGASAIELSTYFDLAILDEVPEHRRNRGELIQIIETSLREYAEPDGKDEGWVIEGVSVDGDHVRVDVAVPLQAQYSRENIETVLGLPDTGQDAAAQLRKLLSSVDDDERAELIDRIVRTRRRNTTSAEIELAFDGDRYLIVGGKLNGADMRVTLGAMARAADEKAAASAAAEPADQRSLAYRAGYYLGGPALLGGLIYLVVTIVQNRRRR